jgi:hypothetical protein
MSLYAWREVLSWIREILGTDPDEGIEYLSDTQLADLNVDLAAIRAERADGSSILARGNRIDGAAAWLPRSSSPHD